MDATITITVATAGLVAFCVLAEVATPDQAPVPQPVPMAGNSVAEPGHQQSSVTVLRGDAVAMRRILAHAAQ